MQGAGVRALQSEPLGFCRLPTRVHVANHRRQKTRSFASLVPRMARWRDQSGAMTCPSTRRVSSWHGRHDQAKALQKQPFGAADGHHGEPTPGCSVDAASECTFGGAAGLLRSRLPLSERFRRMAPGCGRVAGGRQRPAHTSMAHHCPHRCSFERCPASCNRPERCGSAMATGSALRGFLWSLCAATAARHAGRGDTSGGAVPADFFRASAEVVACSVSGVRDGGPHPNSPSSVFNGRKR